MKMPKKSLASVSKLPTLDKVILKSLVGGADAGDRGTNSATGQASGKRQWKPVTARY